MQVIHTKLIDCSGITAAACYDLCLAALGHGLGFALRANLPDDVVHGYVTVAHNFPPRAHEIWVEIYDQDEAPNGGHQSTLKRPTPFPTGAAIRGKLDAWVAP